MNHPAIRPQAERAPAVDAATLARWLDAGPRRRRPAGGDAGHAQRLRGRPRPLRRRARLAPVALQRVPGRAALAHRDAAARQDGGELLHRRHPLREGGAVHAARPASSTCWQLDGGILKYFEQTGGRHFEGALLRLRRARAARRRPCSRCKVRARRRPTAIDRHAHRRQPALDRQVPPHRGRLRREHRPDLADPHALHRAARAARRRHRARRRLRHRPELRAAAAGASAAAAACSPSSRARRCTRRRARRAEALRAAGWSVELHLRERRGGAPRRVPDAMLWHYVHDISRTPAALDNLFAQCRPGTRLAIAGMKFFPWWLAPLNLLAWLKNRPYNVHAHELHEPWSLLAPRLDGFVLGANAMGHGLPRLGRGGTARESPAAAPMSAERYAGVRAASMALAAPLSDGGLPGAVDARREPGEVAPRAHHLVLRDLRARTLRAGLRGPSTRPSACSSTATTRASASSRRGRSAA